MTESFFFNFMYLNMYYKLLHVESLLHIWFVTINKYAVS